MKAQHCTYVHSMRNCSHLLWKMGFQSLIPRNIGVLRSAKMFLCIHNVPSLIPSLKRCYYWKEQFPFFSRRTSGLLSLLQWVPDQTASLLLVYVMRDFSKIDVSTNQARAFFIFICLTNCQFLIRECEEPNLKRI